MVEGLSQFETLDVKADLVNRNLFIKIAVPDIRIRGFYQAEGKALVVTIKGDGPFTANLKDAVGQGFSRIVEIGPPDNRSLSVVDTDIDFNVGDLKIELRNLFDGKYPVLAKTTNEFLNLNSGRQAPYRKQTWIGTFFFLVPCPLRRGANRGHTPSVIWHREYSSTN